MTPVEKNALSDREIGAWLGCLSYFLFFLAILILTALFYIITEP